jgi:hypothetical protein
VRNRIMSMGVQREAPVSPGGRAMDAVIYLVGLVVIVMAILSFFGLR